ncbi:MFS transporter [Corallococcus sp. H22C18031201]|uniref:MFS transporter n=1 Tax=Citreicoccus inhibens TaxID=2849499 RepID=UPI000E70F263|nr:MFS transporter [Citreicoccus inhibens]MBU8898659.1 MFS transporter [Citreicoccus inhibens]RJS15974.1 MFS transporter [Corallococcus sp. H22C18031201]
MAPANADPLPSVFRHRDFRVYQLARLCAVLATQIESVAIGWQVYALTGSALALGYTGLAQFLPFLAFSLIGGQVADRVDRRLILAVCQSVMVLCSLMLLSFTLGHVQDVRFVYGVLVLFGTARAFYSPAGSALTPRLVPPEELTRAVAVNSTTWQVATIAGPAVGGILYGWAGAKGAYIASASLCALTVVWILSLKVRTGSVSREPFSLETLGAGLRFVRGQRMLLGSITLDLFAVMLGGAVALLPIYARDVLHTGPWGLGLLRSAPAAGAAVVAILLAFRPLGGRAGWKMFVAVAIFGAATLVFGVSHSLWVSVVALAIGGAADMVSVVVRSTLEMVVTPDDMRGRVGAVNMMCVGASNEFGEFRAGWLASQVGAVPAVVSGALGTLVVVGLWAWAFPELRRVDRLEKAAREAAAQAAANQDVAPAAS